MSDEASVRPRRGADGGAARREAILAAALEEFCERGFAATRVEDVARRADIAKGTIYLWFKDKEALFQELIRARIGKHVRRLEGARPQPGQSVRATIEEILVPLVEQLQTARIADLLRLMIAESGRFPELTEFYYREVLQRAMKAIERLAIEGRNSGELATDALVRFPPLLGAPIALTLVWGTLFEQFLPLDRPALLGAYLDLVFRPGVDGGGTPIKGDLTDEEAWALEERFWLEGPSVYDAHLDPACLVAFPGIGVLRAADVADAVQGAPRWEAVDLADRRVSRPAAGLIVLGYTGEGHCPGVEPYRCFCTSTYRVDAGQWKLIQHQQTLAG